MNIETDMFDINVNPKYENVHAKEKDSIRAVGNMLTRAISGSMKLCRFLQVLPISSRSLTLFPS